MSLLYRSSFFFACLLLALFCPSAEAAISSKEKVELVETDGRWELHRHGQPYVIKGLGISGALGLDRVEDLGANSIRTWGIEALEEKDEEGRTLLDAAQARGLTVCAGLWIQHERHGFSYRDPEVIAEQRSKIMAAVRKYKDHPALLLWGLGNEMENGLEPDTALLVWHELEALAGMVKEEDPNHPVLTAVAAVNPPKIKEMIKEYPSIDILGVNTYAGSASTGSSLLAVGWQKPFVLTEFGPIGHWEAAKAPWGAQIEETGNEKARRYFTALEAMKRNTEGLCLGSYAFLWGNKQETTATWYGLLLSTGEKVPAVDAIVRSWTGSWPEQRCPRLASVDFPLALRTGQAGEKVTVTAKADDPENDPLIYEWSVREESTDLKQGGDEESVPRLFSSCIPSGENGPTVELTLPQDAGYYRLFLVVRDGQGGATTANYPFAVE